MVWLEQEEYKREGMSGPLLIRNGSQACIELIEKVLSCLPISLIISTPIEPIRLRFY